MRMRPTMIMAIASLAMVSACGSSSGHAASSTGAARTNSASPAAGGVPAVKADIPGFSGAVDPSRAGQVAHAFGRCLRSWYTKAGSATRVHVDYPGPANISVDLTIDDQSEPPSEAHHQFVMAGGRHTKDLKFPAVPHAGYPQITVTSGQRVLICDVPEH
jgi:hypothetical protein